MNVDKDRAGEFIEQFLNWVENDKPALIDGLAYNRFLELVDKAKSCVITAPKSGISG